jgi:Fe-S-cluster containining protein
MSDDHGSAASRLCRSCGLCCNGTIFDYVPVTDEESERLVRRLPMQPDDGERGRHFELGCPALGKRGCGVYADRPISCSSFRCKLLRKVESGETTGADALELIGGLLALVRRLDLGLPAGKSLRARRQGLGELYASGGVGVVAVDEMLHDMGLVGDLVRRDLVDDED